MADESAAPPSSPPIVKLGAWIYDRRNGTLTSEGRTNRLEPRVAQLLDFFIARQGELITREEALKSIWGGVTVVDDVFQRCLSRLRVALEDNPKDPRFIETSPKRGYRFLVAAEPIAAAAPAPSRALIPRRAAPWMVAAAALVVVGFAASSAFSGANRSGAPSNPDAAFFASISSRDAAEAAAARLRTALTRQPTDGALQAQLALALAEAEHARQPDPQRLAQIEAAAAAARADTRAGPLALLATATARKIAGDSDGALEAIRAVPRHSSFAQRAALMEAEILIARDEAPAALDILYRLHDLPDLEFDAVLATGEAYLRLGYLEKAAIFFHRALALSPASDPAAAGLAEVAVAEGDLDAAAAQCASVLRRLVDAPSCSFVVATAHALNGEADQARPLLQLMIDQDQYAAYAQTRLRTLNGQTPSSSSLALGAEAAIAHASAVARRGDNAELALALAAARSAGWRKWWWDQQDPHFIARAAQPAMQDHLALLTQTDGAAPSLAQNAEGSRLE